jgi:hypothetical protein
MGKAGPEAPRLSRKPLGKALANAALKPADLSSPALLFDDWALALTPALKKRIKAEVALRLAADAQPTEAQWKLIFSRTPATNVMAGAGSGKSTSLVLRLLVMHHYLGFELETLTVVTFTRESRADFIRKLLQVFEKWAIKLSTRSAEEVVRTFHSRLLPLVASLPGLADVQAFEGLGSNTLESSGNPFDLRMTDAQRTQLNLCYSSLLTRDPTFRACIMALRVKALQLPALDLNHPDVQKRLAVTDLAARRDEELCDLIEDHWFQAGAWPIDGIEPQRKSVQINGSVFYCHGYIAEMDAWVVLGLDPGANPDMCRAGARLPVRAEWAVKRTLFQAFCDKPLIWLNSYQEGQQLWGALAQSSVAGPGFAYALRGDLAAVPLLDGFYAAAGFMENLGLNVTTAISAMNPAAVERDADFLKALALFWPAFNQHLRTQSPPVLTYNGMFAMLGEGPDSAVGLLSDTMLRPFTHLMIDEFQDISPQIVGWIRACIREQRDRAHVARPGQAHPSSLMCVGDDWQSIYGWRGSSPHYFLQFKKAFPAVKTTRVMLIDNFRSHQHVIDAAQHLVATIKALPGKLARAAGPQAHHPVPVQVLTKDIEDLVQRVEQHREAGHTILILCRKSADKQLIQNRIFARNSDRTGPPQVRMMTYHSAKGLQADAVFLLGDCVYNTQSPYRNQAYHLAGLAPAHSLEGYDLAQRDEVLRLAYVAVTRAIRYCYWYVEKDSRDNAVTVRASSQVDGQAAYFTDLRSHSGGEG